MSRDIVAVVQWYFSRPSSSFMSAMTVGVSMGMSTPGVRAALVVEEDRLREASFSLAMRNGVVVGVERADG